MKVRNAVLVTGLAVALLGSPAAAAPAKETPKTVKPDLKLIAKRVVVDTLKVNEKDVVLIEGDVRDIALLEELRLEAQKAGGTVLFMPSREAYDRRFLEEVPEKHFGKAAALWLKLWPLITVWIDIYGQENPGLLKNIPPAKLVARDKPWKAVFDLLAKRHVRRVQLGNGLYPTTATAKQYSMTRDQLAALYYGGLTADPARLRESAEAARALLAKGKQLHLTSPGGTDLKLRIERRPIVVSDGQITDAKVKKGGSAAWAYLPAGDVMFAPVPKSAEGKVVFDRVLYEDGEIRGLTFVFKAGKVTSMEAKPGPTYDRFKAAYQAAPARKDEFAGIDLGVNPDIKAPRGSKLLTWVPAGTVTVAIGGNLWAGGDNTMAYGAGGFITDGTVTVDDKPLIEKGSLKVGPAAK